MKTFAPCLLSSLVSIWCLNFAGALCAQEEIDITHFARGTTPPVPVALRGYSGEAASVLRFDLEIAGGKIVAEDQAQFILAGSNDGKVAGVLTDRANGARLLGLEFTGGSTRSQAHSLADKVIEKITGKPGVATTKIAFKVSQGRTSEVYLADYDGHNAKALTADGSLVAAPAWAPDRRTLYYTSYKLGNPDILSHDLRTGDRRIVANYSGLNTSVAVSADGRWLAMILSKGGSPDVYVANADGSNLRQITRTRGDESSPCWSPDGRTLCFASRERGSAALYTIPATGGTMTPLRTLLSTTTEPDWSPDGRWIAFTRQRGGERFDVCVVPAAGGESKVLVEGEDPSWAPNSRTLVFTRRVAGSRVLSLLDVPTRQMKDVHRISGACSQPSWAR